MRIFVLGVGGAGSLLAQLLVRQGHTVWCGDRDPERARKFLGKKSTIEVVEANARNLWSIVRAARGCNLLVNASPAVFNEIILRAALRLRVALPGPEFAPEPQSFQAGTISLQQTLRGEKSRGADLHRRGSGAHESSRQARLGAAGHRGIGADSPVRKHREQRSGFHLVAGSDVRRSDFQPARVSHTDAFALAKRFAEREKFRFPPPIGEATVYLAAQDEVCMLPYVVPMQDMDAKIGGNDFDRLFRWYRQGRLNRSQGIVRKRFPKTLTPKGVAGLIRSGVLENARFAAAVLVRGTKDDQPLLLRYDASFPTLFQIRQRGLISTPIAYATAHLAAFS